MTPRQDLPEPGRSPDPRVVDDEPAESGTGSGDRAGVSSAAPRERGRPGQDRIGGAVLAGGGSRRMGRDKAGIEVAGSSLLARTRTVLAAALGPQAPVVTVGSPGDPRPGPWIPDLRPGAGPLAGLEAALDWGRQQELAAVLVVGVDHPWLEPAVLRLLVDRLLAGDRGPAGTALGTADGPLLLLGAYRTGALSVVAGLLDQGERRLQALADHLDLDVVAAVDWHLLDPSGATAMDVDAPADLEAPHRHLGERDPHRHLGERDPRRHPEAQAERETRHAADADD